MPVKINIDGQEIDVQQGQSVLQACLEHDIYVPHICSLPEIQDRGASCRLCMVQMEGYPIPQAACSIPVSENMSIKTDTEEVRSLQKEAFRLLLSTHDISCGTCEANGKCELQNIAKFLKVKLSSEGLAKYLKEPAIDEDHPCAIHYRNRCVLCARCLSACEKIQGTAQFSFSKRGIDMQLSFMGMMPEVCSACSKDCIAVCPTGALIPKS